VSPGAGIHGRVEEVPRVGRIVVGVDASPEARQALAWAAAEARLRQAVHAYHAKSPAAPVYFGSQHTWDAAVGAENPSRN
jgi:nucleotide-binding universal stress UspA family protein